jgi:hypothetical protein
MDVRYAGEAGDGIHHLASAAFQAFNAFHHPGGAAFVLFGDDRERADFVADLFAFSALRVAEGVDVVG